MHNFNSHGTVSEGLHRALLQNKLQLVKLEKTQLYISTDQPNARIITFKCQAVHTDNANGIYT